MGGPGTDPELSQQEHLLDKAFPNPLFLGWNKSKPEFSQFKEEVLFPLHIFFCEIFWHSSSSWDVVPNKPVA